jgi:ABC-type transporter Mla subunit MlaD
MGFLSRAVLIMLVAGLAAINAAGVYSQLVAAHFGDRMSTTGAVQTEAATVTARIDAQTHALADVDTRLSQIDGAIAEMTKRGRANGALDAINSQRKARAELVAQCQREADLLTGLKTVQAAGAARAHAVEVEAAPIMHMAQLLGGSTEQAIRWLILAMVLCCDPLAIALTAAASARR